jgi:hypothetical protein
MINSNEAAVGLNKQKLVETIVFKELIRVYNKQITLLIY